MGVTQTGSVSFYNAGSGDTGTQSVTIPSDATVMLVGGDGYNGADDTFGKVGYATLTVGGNASFAKLSAGSGSAWQSCLYAFDVRSLQGQTVNIAWDWYGTLIGSVRLMAAYYTGADATAVRDSDTCTHGSPGEYTLPSMTTVAGDLVVAYNACYRGSTRSWTNVTEVAYEVYHTGYDGSVSLASAAASGTSLTVSNTWTYDVDGDGSMCGLVLIPAAMQQAPRSANFLRRRIM